MSKSIHLIKYKCAAKQKPHRIFIIKYAHLFATKCAHMTRRLSWTCGGGGHTPFNIIEKKTTTKMYKVLIKYRTTTIRPHHSQRTRTSQSKSMRIILYDALLDAHTHDQRQS